MCLGGQAFGAGQPALCLFAERLFVFPAPWINDVGDMQLELFISATRACCQSILVAAGTTGVFSRVDTSAEACRMGI